MNSKELEEIDNKVLKLLESKDWKSKWLPHNSEIRQIFVTRTPFEYYKILLSNPSYTEEELLERQIHSASVDDEEDFMQGFDNEKEYLAVFCISKNLELDIPFKQLNPECKIIYTNFLFSKFMFVYIPDKLSNSVIRLKTNLNLIVAEEIDKVIGVLEEIFDYKQNGCVLSE